MRNRQQEELRRLEEALLAGEYTEEPREEDLLADTWQELSETDYDIYNTDETDVDMDGYSEDVYHGSGRSGVVPFLVLLTVLLLGAIIAYMLKFLGVF